MKTSILILVLTLLFLQFPIRAVFAQFEPTPVEISSNQTEIDGQVFFLHEVKKGHTLYSIAKAYSVDQQIILEVNPGLADTGLKAGMVIKVPSVLPASERDPAYRYHRILEKETWFSISKQYGTTVKDLKRSNPQFKWGIPAGDTLLIPKNKITNPEIDLIEFENEPIRDTVIQTDSLTVQEPLSSSDETTKDSLTWYASSERPYIDIGLILPLQIHMYDTLPLNDSIPHDFRFWEFLQGAFVAVDSLENLGISLRLHVFDSERTPYNTHAVEKLIHSGALNAMDLIIGPVYTNTLNALVPYAESRQIPVVSPLSSRTGTTEGHPLLFQVNPSEEGLNKQVARYLGEAGYDQIVIVAPYAEKYNSTFRLLVDEIRASRNRQGTYDRLPALFFQRETQSFIDLDSLPGSLYQSLKPGKTNLVVIPSDDEVFATEMINRLKNMPESYDLTVFGKPSWREFNTIDLQYLFDLKVQYYTTFLHPFVDYEDPAVQHFCKNYRNDWNTEPTRFSFQGFDILFHFANQESRDQFLQTPMAFRSVNRRSGFENQAVQIIRYNPVTLTVERVAVIHDPPTTRFNRRGWQP